ncbi:MAG: sigma 54-interacting transcriptional regulator [Deltaproteobacteria bacterium]|nr:sigma 54-interacting transcriptional regulator [Deltaproteobacteria bacterium]MBW2071097.1 sigma 54-interacting transcriptional regulator [Deltaproteobacteria bacterium]
MADHLDATACPYTQAALSPDWFEAILCSLNDGVFCVDANWRITCFNRAAAEITGVPREQALGRPCHEVFRSNICKKACALRFTMETGKPVINLVISIVNSVGSKVPISISTAVLKDKNGKIVGGVETFRDLSLVEQLRKEIDKRHTFEDIISESPKMAHLFDMIPVIAASDSTVLITGESGTGKGLVARAVHNLSPRQKLPFVTVNCGAIPETLLESELFGYKAGAFTDARKDKPGRFALAQGGTIFLDEIGDIPTSIQAKLLRVLQEKIFEPLGGVQGIRADVRIIAATNRDLVKLVEQGLFRTDLYYRVNVFQLVLPPLRDRKEDIPLLVEHFITKLSALKGKDIAGITPEAIRILMNHNYPGNVRELENIIEHAFVICPGGMIQAHHLPDNLLDGAAAAVRPTLKLVDQYERELILTALRKNRWNRLQTARDLGIHKTTLFRKIRKLGINLPRKDGRSKG